MERRPATTGEYAVTAVARIWLFENQLDGWDSIQSCHSRSWVRSSVRPGMLRHHVRRDRSRHLPHASAGGLRRGGGRAVKWKASDDASFSWRRNGEYICLQQGRNKTLTFRSDERPGQSDETRHPPSGECRDWGAERRRSPSWADETRQPPSWAVSVRDPRPRR